MNETACDHIRSLYKTVQAITAIDAVGWFQTKRHVNDAHAVFENNRWPERGWVHQHINATHEQQRLMSK
jgi:hypothetical protein